MTRRDAVLTVSLLAASVIPLGAYALLSLRPDRPGVAAARAALLVIAAGFLLAAGIVVLASGRLTGSTQPRGVACPGCGSACPRGSRYCGACGGSLGCPECSPARAAGRPCPRCGAGGTRGA